MNKLGLKHVNEFELEEILNNNKLYLKGMKNELLAVLEYTADEFYTMYDELNGFNELPIIGISTVASYTGGAFLMDKDYCITPCTVTDNNTIEFSDIKYIKVPTITITDETNFVVYERATLGELFNFLKERHPRISPLVFTYKDDKTHMELHPGEKCKIFVGTKKFCEGIIHHHNRHEICIDLDEETKEMILTKRLNYTYKLTEIENVRKAGSVHC